jgi:molybdopterin/thiamine biosynthesis adenylyltransferase
MVVGVGALGCEIAKNLALVGIGTLTLVDMDIIETSNLSRQLLFQEMDRGRLKAEVAREKLESMNPNVNIQVHTTKFQQLPMKVFEDADVIVGGLDSFRARFALNRIVHELSKPYVDGAATGFKGNVQVIIPKGCDIAPNPTPCLRCFFPVPPADEKVYMACSIPGEPRSREQCILKAEDEFVREHGIRKEYSESDLESIAHKASEFSATSPHTQPEEFLPEEVENIIKNKIPSILTVNAVISGIVSHEVLKIIHRLEHLDIGELMSPPYIEYNSWYGIFTPVEIARDENCAVCGRERVSLVLEMKSDSILNDIFNSLRKEGFDLPNAVLLTRVIDGNVISAMGQDSKTRNLNKLGIKNRDILRATYASQGEDGRPERKQVEFMVDMEGSA